MSVTIFSCPLCKKALSLEDRSYNCSSGHCYDVAKEGYVNLLLANQKNSKQPGDSKEMIRSRRSFLDQGYYDPLIAKMIDLLSSVTSGVRNCLDLGCGEGYYLAKLANAPKLKINNSYGIDISKAAIQLAAKKYTDLSFAVSSSNNLAVLSGVIDVVVVVFAPVNSEELHRIVNESGHVLIVSAGPQHHKELATMIYDTPRPHDYDPAENLKSNFQLTNSEQMSFNIELDSSETILQLLQMTPYYWHTSQQKLAEIKKLTNLKLNCDFKLSLFQKKKQD